jgi:hypothetical protein
LSTASDAPFSFYSESAVEAEEKPSPPIIDVKKSNRQGAFTVDLFERNFSNSRYSKWDDWLASSFGLEVDDDNTLNEEAAVRTLNPEAAVCVSDSIFATIVPHFAISRVFTFQFTSLATTLQARFCLAKTVTAAASTPPTLGLVNHWFSYQHICQ